MKIHVTHTTKVILDDLGEYITENRGSLEIKGKGDSKGMIFEYIYL
jgi:hypothetical protein